MRGRFGVFRVMIIQSSIACVRARARTRKRRARTHSHNTNTAGNNINACTHTLYEISDSIDGRQRLPGEIGWRRTYGGNPSRGWRARSHIAHIWQNVIAIIILLSCRIAHPLDVGVVRMRI